MFKLYKLIILLLSFVFLSCFVSAAVFFMETESDNLYLDCENNIDIMIDTQGEEIFGASLNISYDSSNLELIGFYLNEDFNLPLEYNVKDKNNLSYLDGAALSLIRDSEFRQIGFTGIVKFATLVIKNKEPIDTTNIDFIFSGSGISNDNMDVFRLGDAKDVLSSVQSKKFEFVQGECVHAMPVGSNQLDSNYDFRQDLNNKLDNIYKVEKQYKYKKLFNRYWSYGLILLLVIVFILVYKKRSKNSSVLKNKGNKND